MLRKMEFEYNSIVITTLHFQIPKLLSKHTKQGN